MATFNLGVDQDDGWVSSDYDYYTTGACGAIGGDGIEYFSMWFRFVSVTIPQYANITSAYLTYVVANESFCYLGTTTAANSRIYANKAVNPVIPTDWPDYNGKSLTSAGVDQNSFGPTSGTSYNSVDISTVVKEIVDQSGWASGQALMIMWRGDPTPANATGIANYGHATYNPATLTITYSGTSPPDKDVSPTLAQRLTQAYSPTIVRGEPKSEGWGRIPI